VVLRSSPQCLEFRSSSENWRSLLVVVVGWSVVAGWLAWWIHPAVALGVSLVFWLGGVLPLLWRLLVQRRFSLDRTSDEVRVRQYFHERFLCRISDILAVQVVGNSERIELNLAMDNRSRLTLIVLQTCDDRSGLLQDARRLAGFLEVPLADQVEAMALVGTAELADQVVVESTRTVGPVGLPIGNSCLILVTFAVIASLMVCLVKAFR